METLILAPAISWLAVGTTCFFILIALEFLLLLWSLCLENGFWATMSLIIFTCLLRWVCGLDIIGLVCYHPWVSLTVIACYLPLGVVSSIGLWWSYVTDVINREIDNKDNWIQNQFGRWRRPNEEEASQQQIAESWNKHIDSVTPKASERKARIVRTMAYWPVYDLKYLLDDFFRKVFETIYRRFAEYYQQMADRIASRAKM